MQHSNDTMTRRMLFPSIFAALVLACQPSGDDVAPEDRGAEIVTEGRTIEISFQNADFDRTDIEDVVAFVEGHGEVAQAKVKVKKHDDETTIAMELWGSELPTAEELERELPKKFAFLEGAEVRAQTLAGEDAPAPRDEEQAEDPEEAKRAIIERLRADGVEGDIDVQVTDHEDGGREVEVRVEKHEGGPEADEH